MSEEPRGWRAVPTALLLAMIAWILVLSFRLALFLADPDRGWSARMSLFSEGVAVACYVLAFIGALELARRLTGRAGLGARVTAAGFGFALGVEMVSGLLNFRIDLWRHEWVGQIMQHSWFAAWLIVPVGLVIALWSQRRTLAIAGLAVAVLTDPAPFLAERLYGWLATDFRTHLMLDSALRIARCAMILAMIVAVARGISTLDRAGAASGLRAAARAMWLRVIAAAAVVLMTLLAISGGGRSESSVETLKLAMVASAIVNLMSLVMFGLGVARTARGALVELPRVPLVLAAGGALWCAGVGFGQLPYIYRQLYGGGGSYGPMGDFTQVFVVAVPVVVIVAAGLVAYAIHSFAERRNAGELRQQAQAKGVGFVAMMLASLGITQWMVPRAESLGALAMLMLLAAVAGLVATMMLGRLCTLAVEEIEREAGLPTASVVSDST